MTTLETLDDPKFDLVAPRTWSCTKFELSGLENLESCPQEIPIQEKFPNFSLVFERISRGQNNSPKAVNVWLRNLNSWVLEVFDFSKFFNTLSMGLFMWMLLKYGKRSAPWTYIPIFFSVSIDFKKHIFNFRMCEQ